MRLSLGFQVVQGSGEVAEPTYWPAYVAVDDGPLRSLAGDVVSNWLVAPGPLGKGELPSWLGDVAEIGLAGAGHVGFGLVYSDGGATDEATAAAYQDLIATLHGAVLQHVAGASQLGPLLSLFGGGGDKPISLDQLRDGVDPAELRKQLGDDLVTGVAAFRSVGDALLPFTQGVPFIPATVPPRKAVTGITGGAVLTRAPVLTHVPAAPRPPVAARALEPGTVVAVTAQFFRLADIAAKGSIGFERELPARVGLKSPLRITGKVNREEQQR